MAYKFQLGAATLSGSLTQEGAGEFDTSLTIGSAVMSETDLEKLDGITNGTGEANKALVLDGSRDIDTINALGIASMSSNWTNAGRTVADMGIVTTIDLNGGAIDGTIIGANTAAAGTFAAIVGTTINGTNISGSGFVAADQGQFRDLGAEDLNVSGDADVGGALSAVGAISGSAALSIGGTIRFDGAVDAAAVDADSIYFFDATDNLMKKERVTDLRDLYFADVSGDATIAAGGALTIAAGAVENSMLADDAVDSDELAAGAVDLAHMSVNSVDSDQYVDGSIDLAHMSANSVDSDQYVDGSIDLVHMSANSVDSDQYVDGSIDNIHLADDAVGADELAANAVVNASVASGAAIVATKLDFNVDLGGDITFGNQSDDTISTTGHLTVGGNLTVNGSVTSVNSSTINITSSFTFEGLSVDDFETTLHSGTPTQDITVYLPQYSASAGAHSAYLPVLAGAPTAASALVTAAEFALLDGASSIGTTAVSDGHGIFMNQGGTMAHTTVQTLAAYLDDEITAMPNLVTTAATTVGALGAGSIAAGFTKINLANILDLASIDIDGGTDIGADLASADLIIVDDAAGGTNRKATIGRVAKYVGDNLALNINSSDDGETFEVGFNYWNATLGGAESGTLPASPSAGQVVYIKAPSNCSTTNKITINKAGSQTIDGEIAIILESPNAAVSLMYVAADLWKIF